MVYIDKHYKFLLLFGNLNQFFVIFFLWIKSKYCVCNLKNIVIEKMESWRCLCVVVVERKTEREREREEHFDFAKRGKTREGRSLNFLGSISSF